MNTLQILKDARALISDPENWLQTYYSNAPFGRVDSGTKFCAIGAIAKASGLTHGACAQSVHATNALANVLGFEDNLGCPVPKYNNTHTHAEVLALFDKAIAKLSEPDNDWLQKIISNHDLIQDDIDEQKRIHAEVFR